MLEHIKLLTGNDDEGLLQLLIDKTKLELSTTGKDYDSTWDNVIEDIVCFKLNRLNHEGTSSYNINGMSESFTTSYPSYITNQLASLGLPIAGRGVAKML